VYAVNCAGYGDTYLLWRHILTRRVVLGRHGGGAAIWLYLLTYCGYTYSGPMYYALSAALLLALASFYAYFFWQVYIVVLVLVLVAAAAVVVIVVTSVYAYFFCQV